MLVILNELLEIGQKTGCVTGFLCYTHIQIDKVMMILFLKNWVLL